MAMAATRNHIPVVLFMNITMAVATAATLAIGLSLGARPTTGIWGGLFGFLHPQWNVPLHAGALAIFVGYLGTTVVSKYVSPVVVSTFLAMEPPTAIALGLLVGVEGCPSGATTAGAALMVLAAMWVSISARDDNDEKLVLLDVHAPNGAGDQWPCDSP